ncbi:peroxiredoxin [Crossiella cryophila]|uniref:Alkyl hydroperoxide reductase E n=1 Tax=Crossiella cryophila TaxID=43355 RepID=A0A7W7FX53_9PSEU|nr:peroxiredoxin [Crossiella cryophila]
MRLEVGNPAPDFTLENSHREPVTLSSFAGHKNVLLVYYPRAFTPICRGELCQLRDELDIYQKYDVQIIGVSVDTPFSLKAWASQQGYPFPLLSDFWPHGEVATTYGTFDDRNGVARRGTFLIDTEGIIRFAEVQQQDAARDQDAWKSAVTSMLGARDLSKVSIPVAPGNWITLPGAEPSEAN